MGRAGVPTYPVGGLPAQHQPARHDGTTRRHDTTARPWPPPTRCSRDRSNCGTVRGWRAGCSAPRTSRPSRGSTPRCRTAPPGCASSPPSHACRPAGRTSCATSTSPTAARSVALDPSGTIVAVGRFMRYHDEPDTAEAAFVVADAWQGHGIGPALLDVLVPLRAGARDQPLGGGHARREPGDAGRVRALPRAFHRRVVTRPRPHRARPRRVSRPGSTGLAPGPGG